MVGMSHGPAVPDHEVAPGAPRHRPAVVLGALLPDEVQHDLRALAIGHVENLLHVLAVHDDRLLALPSLRA